MARGEGIKKLSSLFDKYKNVLVAPQGTVISAFQEVISDIFNYDIPKENITYATHSKTLSVRVAGPLKSEIMLRKKEILTHLKGRLGEKGAPNEIL